MSTPLPPSPPPVPSGPAPDTRVPPAPDARPPRSLPAGAGTSWWSESWRIFTAAPGMWILILVVFVVIMVALNFVPVLGGLASQILSPVFIGGLMLGCHALARGEPLTLNHLFAGFSGPHFAPLAILGLIMFGISLGVLLVFAAVLLATVGVTGMSALMTGDATQFGVAALATLGLAGLVLTLIGLLVAVVVAMLYWFAPPLIAIDGLAPIDAMKASWRASLANITPFLLYGLIGLGLAIAASIPFGLGWLVLGPMVAGSVYASWRQVFSA